MIRAVAVSSSSTGFVVAGRVRGVTGGRRVSGHAHDDELGIPPLQAQLDRLPAQFGADLSGGVRQGLEDRHPHGGIERWRDSFDRVGQVVPAGRSGRQQISPQVLDVPGDVHVHHYDIRVMS